MKIVKFPTFFSPSNRESGSFSLKSFNIKIRQARSSCLIAWQIYLKYDPSNIVALLLNNKQVNDLGFGSEHPKNRLIIEVFDWLSIRNVRERFLLRFIYSKRKRTVKRIFFLDLCRCALWTLNFILCGPIFKRCHFWCNVSELFIWMHWAFLLKSSVRTSTCFVGRIYLLPSTTKLRRLCFYTCLSVIPFTWGSASVHAGIPPSQEQAHPPPHWDQAPLGPGTPQSRYPPGTRHPSPRSRRLLLRTVPILLECIHVNQKRSRSTIVLFLKLEFLTWHDKISFAIKFPDNAAVDIFWCGFYKSSRLSKCRFVVVEVKFIEKIMHKIIVYDPNNNRVLQQIR